LAGSVLHKPLEALADDNVLGASDSLHILFNPLQTKRRLLYLKTQSVSRSKHFSSRL